MGFCTLFGDGHVESASPGPAYSNAETFRRACVREIEGCGEGDRSTSEVVFDTYCINPLRENGTAAKSTGDPEHIIESGLDRNPIRDVLARARDRKDAE